jgi:hypothetical protein
MPDTTRTIAELQTIFADGQAPGSITPQDTRDLIVSIEAFDGALDTRIDDLESTIAESGTAFPAGGTTGQVLTKQSGTDFDTAWDDAGGIGGAIVTDATTARTLELTDAGDYVDLTSASAVTVTVPPNASVAFPAGTTITLEQAGAGQVTVAAGAGVTVNVAATHLRKTAGQYAVVSLTKKAADVWTLYGNLEEAP